MLHSLRYLVLFLAMSFASFLPAQFLSPYFAVEAIEARRREQAMEEETEVYIPRPGSIGEYLLVDMPNKLEMARTYGMMGDVDSLRKVLEEIEEFVAMNRASLKKMANYNGRDENKLFIRKMARVLLTKRYLNERFGQGYTLAILREYNLNPAYPAFRKRQMEEAQ